MQKMRLDKAFKLIGSSNQPAGLKPSYFKSELIPREKVLKMQKISGGSSTKAEENSLSAITLTAA